MLRGCTAYRADGRLAALAHSNRQVRLIEPGSGRRVATLLPSQTLIISGLAFSPSGDRLAVTTEGHIIQLWDLRAIRRRLAGLRLDWDRPPDTPPSPSSSRPLVA